LRKKIEKLSTINLLKPYSSTILSLAGILLAGMGLFFIFLRPALLPEDLRYMGLTGSQVNEDIPGLANWLQKVFWVMGGYIFSSGVLTVFISQTTFRKHLPGSFGFIALAGISSIGLMTVANFIIDSDFKWVLLSFTSLWAASLTLYRYHK
jgi:hypothetical protein